MAITITRSGRLYSASVTPPHAGGAEWASRTPMPVPELVHRLQELGCHQTDIGDAFHAADPDWLNRDHDRE